jgi:hypothetical protein
MAHISRVVHNPSSGQIPDLYLQGDTEEQVNAGDQYYNCHVFQNVGQTGYIDTASHVLVDGLGD